jgi:hypothetical protein
VGSTSASTAFDLHARPQVSWVAPTLPPPVPISPSPIQSSQHPKRPGTLFLDNTTLPARTLDHTPLQSLRPDLQSSTPPQVLFPLANRSSSPTCSRFPSPFLFLLLGQSQLSLPRQIFPETSAHLQAHLRHFARPSSLLPASPFHHPPPNTHRRLLRYRLAGIHLLC